MMLKVSANSMADSLDLQRCFSGDKAQAEWNRLADNARGAWELYARTDPPLIHDVPAVKPQPLIRPVDIPAEPIIDPPLTVEELKEQKEQSFQLQSLLKDASPETLEASVEKGVKILDRIKAPLIGEGVVNSPDAAQWVQHIGKSYRACAIFLTLYRHQTSPCFYYNVDSILMFLQMLFVSRRPRRKQLLELLVIPELANLR